MIFFISARHWYADLSDNPIMAIITVFVILFGTRYVYHRFSSMVQFRCAFNASFTPTKPQKISDPKDHEAQRMAKVAAEQRQKLWRMKQLKKRPPLTALSAPLQPTPTKEQANERNIVTAQLGTTTIKNKTSTPTAMSLEEITAASVPVFDDGLIVFRNLFQMPNAQQTAATLRRLAHEFIPILRQRQYNVTSVSEFCCCGDGMDYQLGGQSLSVRPGERIAGHESERVMGYNRVVLLHDGTNQYCGKRPFGIDTARYTSSIHLRLRSPSDHSQFVSYEQVCEHFCHELAHCVYHDHSTAFYALMRDIQKQHRAKMR
jgi:WLM domain